ncbi:transient receptor potential (TRP) ion channel domain-containing protein [Hirsutella rhossiliensis]|uniref:Transient receptor potential (TRP) ion channel domain-containing protein n=1 Tax=Hirsutella rhossiliensis TaxID=111463 RepID=A0A9P8SJX4_9HYPO|nr:transient receptor potential (TRP) ion channel domain-containing protein [Hirsutella rhossiliensis]KAH0964175.1 transient receptor potential (TRP) ion channel domain-containing protein [Hirsutella rhossiliensis]
MSPARARFSGLFPLVLSLLTFLLAVSAVDKVYITGDGIDGVSRKLDVSRYPALYTGDFDDCMGGESLFNVTRFDAAYYADNLTVLFHLDGTTNIQSENLILHISVQAYGENRFNMTYDPCKANIASMCPLKASVPVTAFATIPISPTDVAGIPSIALGIPDLEGFARLQIFANSTQTEIGCFQAVMRNGNSFSQPKAVGTIMGILTAFATLASFATAVYGLSMTHMRTHYAHSFSVLVIFETFQSIFFSGALSVNWPSVLPAWWSNFAWSAGMFANERIVDSISIFTGTNANISQVGGAGSVQINNGGGLLQQIYGRSLSAPAFDNVPVQALARRAEYNTSNPYEYTWHGHPRTPGMPMPGTWPGFGGTLSAVDVPPAEAFLVSLIWLLVILGGVALFVVVTKLVLDVLVRTKCLKTDGFDYFRSHLGGYLAAAVLRTLFIAFFTIMTLSLFQFSLHGPAGPTAIAAIVWLILLVGVGGLIAYACYSRLRGGKLELCRDTVRLERGTLFRKIPFIAATRASQMDESETREKPYLFGAIPFVRIKYTARDPARPTVHQDEGFTKRFGWLAARYRRTRWWFPAAYIGYLFFRACFIGGGARNPLAQVFGLFIWEILALPVIIKLSPFESNRITAIAIWMLSISKIVTTGLSIAFLPDFGINRIVATVLGIIIIIVQGFIAIAILVLISIGLVSTWMSLSRNREKFPEPLDQTRIRYFEHLEAGAADLPPKPKGGNSPEALAEPYFNAKLEL